MLVVETVARIRRAHFVQGKGIKEIARELGIARNTVRKVLRSGETAFAYEREVQPRPKLGAWTDELERRLNANSRLSRRERLGLIRIYEDLRVQGYQGGYDAVRRYARARERATSVKVVELGVAELATDQAALGGSCRVSLAGGGLSNSPMASTPM